MNRRMAVVAGAGGTALVCAFLAPFLLRQVAFFDVRQVELVGVRYLAADRVLDALELVPDQNVFDRLGPAVERVRRLAGVVSATADRRLPGTIRVRVVERLPVAFVSGADGMIVLDCDARPLPYDPALSGLDLPVVDRADRGVVRTLCIVRASDSTMYHDVNRVTGTGAGAVALNLGRQRILLRTLPTTNEIKAVGAVRRHLAAADRPAEELDARFAGWVVARRGRS